MDSNHVEELHKLLSPYLLRRVKEDVQKDIPPKGNFYLFILFIFIYYYLFNYFLVETIVNFELTTIQKTICRAFLEKNAEFLRSATNHNKTNMNNLLMHVRKVCNHP